MKHQINDKRKPIPLSDDGLTLSDVVKTQNKLLKDGNLNITPEYQDYIIDKPENVQQLSQHYKGLVKGINTKIFHNAAWRKSFFIFLVLFFSYNTISTRQLKFCKFTLRFIAMPIHNANSQNFNCPFLN